MSPPYRVILLLDLDCFYSQCERIRLGLGLETPLALLQWNSVLAVTYPAREAYQIKRGDSWAAVVQKSDGKCLAIHLPILTTSSAQEQPQQPEKDESVSHAYQQVYRLSKEQQKHILETEVGVQRYNYEGKACLERYRLASSRIFGVVLDTLTEKVGRENFVLERASIDELFLDVTEYCWKNDNDDAGATSMEHVMSKTVSVGDTTDRPLHDDDDPDIVKALERGCRVAHDIRKAVFDTLGFTLSAGISTSKLVAKLGASYGKPNGQAVIFPSKIPHVMSETHIHKVRNLGGKIGKQVQALLPPNEPTTMGSIARLFSLPVLCENLGPETGKMVFDACRGMDEEPVRETIGALVKSITAFKSFQKTSITSGELTEWINLLATDVVGRVMMDASRNNRYPKSCTIQYAFSKETLAERTPRTTKSLRIPFPRDDGDVKAKLVQNARDAVLAKEGQVYIYRFGLCAIDFQPRVKHGIESFFHKEDRNAVEHESKSTNTLGANQQPDDIDNVKQCSNPDVARKLASPAAGDTTTNADRDLELARKLQASYDRENYVLTVAENRSHAKPVRSKRQRIDSFFRKA